MVVVSPLAGWVTSVVASGYCVPNPPFQVSSSVPSSSPAGSDAFSLLLSRPLPTSSPPGTNAFPLILNPSPPTESFNTEAFPTPSPPPESFHADAFHTPSFVADPSPTQSSHPDAPPPTPSPVPSPSPKRPSPTNSFQPDASLQTEALNGHNSYRAVHGAPPLAWSNDLEAAAQTWVSGCVFQHSGGKLGPFGENLAAGTGSYSVTDAINGWVSEASDYDPSNPEFSHFTQVVWKGTTQVGCAVHICPPGTIFGGSTQFVTCEYSPPGNVVGEFAKNVQA